MNIDWRNRFGWNWISSVRDQVGSVNCWAFAMTALYEAMVRIEHCVWCRRSEGDLARGAGKQSWDIGNPGEAAFFAENFGIADPDCFPWSVPASLYVSKPHGSDMKPLPLSPTPDRIGRIVKLSERHVAITDVTEKKNWIDRKGPMATMPRGHAILVVGFNDDDPDPKKKYWIFKNSYGTGWGQNGFGQMAWDQLASAEFWGIHNTNPDPWTKRRLRNGVLVESGNGRWHNNFELFIKQGMTLEHWWRDHGTANFPWNKVGIVRSSDRWRDTFHDDALDCPAVIQSTFNRNYEVIYRSSSGRLRHVYYDQNAGWWFDATNDQTFGPSNPVGIPGFIQSTRGAPGDFEVVVLKLNGELEHWTKHNSAPWTQRPGTWYSREQFGAEIRFAGPALVQSHAGIASELEADKGDLHYVCTGGDGFMHHFIRLTGGRWKPFLKFGSNITSAPCMIEGQFDAKDELAPGNFELCVAANGQIEHWWHRQLPGQTWNRSAVFGADVRRVVGLLEGSFGFNLELIAERNDGRYQHYWRDSNGWHAGAIIV
ncbi:MAG: peptidase C1A [Candidatus Jettenia sp.]|uniref:Putative peptidase n=1 Tax=Candidatus Jettenia caeni TaxID=247490 RepID=I3IPE0_9BACT|nr:C1 family peptidase [Candidatus Jettenia sp. AMX1]MBC6930155.1 peptidase C1A [Candidatus Jettenia sp.]NUN22434.1 peptidase C1A [Candidatus Jettenia caeni]KAA0248602.1 MAG: peptidase C1A [Candidatus Jettenia sp. AMX1]MCE7881562.1 peptidase C1A [Candidatus Jettenia sp. AMX1]MCQ3927723.1 peptidase C1A [Candidatus Jettenia sp.]